MDTKVKVAVCVAGLSALVGAYFVGCQMEKNAALARARYTPDSAHPHLESVKIVHTEQYNGHGFEGYAGNTIYFFRDNLGDKVEQLFTDISKKKLGEAAIPGDKRLQIYEWMTKKTAELDGLDKTMIRSGFIRREAVDDYSEALGKSDEFGNNYKNFDLRANACLKTD